MTLPTASFPGIIAASIIARILDEMLARGPIRFLPEETVYYITLSLRSLLHVRQISCLASYAEADVKALRAALKQMALLWTSAKRFDLCYDQIISDMEQEQRREPTTTSTSEHVCLGAHYQGIHAPDCPLTTCLGELDSFDPGFMDFFPTVTSQTTPLLGAILAARQGAHSR
jgi:hypothetical protein